jgi:cysteine desulfurase
MRRVYFDNNATTPLAPEVFEAMRPYLVEDFGNASSIHWYGQRATAIESARRQVAGSSTLMRSSSRAAGQNRQPLLGIVELRSQTKHIIHHHRASGRAQHRRAIEKRRERHHHRVGASVHRGPPTSIAPSARPVLISVMREQQLGTIQPIEEIGASREKDVYSILTPCNHRQGHRGCQLESISSPSRHWLRAEGVGRFPCKGTHQAAHSWSTSAPAPGHGKCGGIVGLGRRPRWRANMAEKLASRLCATGWKRGFSYRTSRHGERPRTVPSTPISGRFRG